MRGSWGNLVGLGLGVLLLASSNAAQAAPITFDFLFEDPSGPAQIEGFITFEESLLPNPAVCPFAFKLPSAGVLALEVTVSGASSGNGTFGLSSFSTVIWCTNAATLDLGMQLVGQTTPGSPWGTPNGFGGDFNLIGPPPAPSGQNEFSLCPAGSLDDCTVLTSMIVGPTRLGRSAPALGPFGLALACLSILALGAYGLRRRGKA